MILLQHFEESTNGIEQVVAPMEFSPRAYDATSEPLLSTKSLNRTTLQEYWEKRVSTNHDARQPFFLPLNDPDNKNGRAWRDQSDEFVLHYLAGRCGTD